MINLKRETKTLRQFRVHQKASAAHNERFGRVTKGNNRLQKFKKKLQCTCRVWEVPDPKITVLLLGGDRTEKQVSSSLLVFNV